MGNRQRFTMKTIMKRYNHSIRNLSILAGPKLLPSVGFFFCSLYSVFLKFRLLEKATEEYEEAILKKLNIMMKRAGAILEPAAYRR